MLGRVVALASRQHICQLNSLTRSSLFVSTRSFASASTEASSTDVRQARIRKMAHRSGQRGMLELDIIMGTWAKKHLPACSDAELDQFAVILKLETPDVLKMVIGQIPIAEQFKHLTLLQTIKDYVQVNRPGYANMHGKPNQ
jgi:succinate dehydrogenase flavin-adding protein (antitoxin of CptAB toxin-antitoxin module)